MSADLVDDPDGHEEEGIEAFNRMADAMRGLQNRLGALDAGMGQKVAKAEQAASKAATAASDARWAAEAAQAVARAQARSLAAWVACGVLGGVLAASGAGYWLGHSSGRESGLAGGYRAAMDEKAAASWANTPTGRLALALDRAGSLDKLARCSGQGWTPAVQGGRRACYPAATAGKPVDGWYLP